MAEEATLLSPTRWWGQARLLCFPYGNTAPEEGAATCPSVACSVPEHPWEERFTAGGA